MDRGAWRATVHGFTESDTHIGNKDPTCCVVPQTHTHTHTHPTQNSFKITQMMRTAEERSVQFSHSVMSDYSRCDGLQHTRFPCLSTTPWICSNSRPSSQWCTKHLTLCHALLLPPSIFPSISVFSNSSVIRIRWAKYWSFSFSISPFNEYSGLISFRMDWFDLLAVQGILKNLLQHHSSNAPILQPSAFLMVQLSHPYMTTEKPYCWLDGPLLAK